MLGGRSRAGSSGSCLFLVLDETTIDIGPRGAILTTLLAAKRSNNGNNSNNSQKEGFEEDCELASC